MSGLWVFGYGSLVSPESFGRTLRRQLVPGIDFFPAELTGFGRRWNYGVMHSTGTWTDANGAQHERTIVALGVVESAAERVNGVVAWVDDDELIELDRRERHYDRVDVAQSTTVQGAVEIRGSIVVYVPREEAVDHYTAARDRGVAAIERRYWNLVDAAFDALGAGQRQRFHATTPAPDVPVLDLAR